MGEPLIELPKVGLSYVSGLVAQGEASPSSWNHQIPYKKRRLRCFFWRAMISHYALQYDKVKPSLPRHWRSQFSHLQQNKGQNTLPIWKMFQDFPRQNKLSGSCAILFGRSWFTSLVRTDSLQTLGNPQTPAWVRFGEPQPEHLSREEQKPTETCCVWDWCSSNARIHTDPIRLRDAA